MFWIWRQRVKISNQNNSNMMDLMDQPLEVWGMPGAAVSGEEAMGISINGTPKWRMVYICLYMFILENPMNMDDLGTSHFRPPSFLDYIPHIFHFKYTMAFTGSPLDLHNKYDLRQSGSGSRPSPACHGRRTRTSRSGALRERLRALSFAVDDDS